MLDERCRRHQQRRQQVQKIRRDEPREVQLGLHQVAKGQGRCKGGGELQRVSGMRDHPVGCQHVQQQRGAARVQL
ncbi:MAG: hypothetical protein EOO54_13710 [Haliea sp.]|nr:MAG: hypothetical protein EOO54_13710 [Haliea sp.]